MGKIRIMVEQKINQDTEHKSLREYFNKFVESFQVSEHINVRYQNAFKIDPTVTWDEAKEAFLRSTQVRELFWTYFNTNSLNLESNVLTGNLNQKLQEYFLKIEEINSRKAAGYYNTNVDWLINDDTNQSILHLIASQELVNEKIVPNTELGRLLVHFMAVTAGYDKADPLREQNRLNRLKNNC